MAKYIIDIEDVPSILEDGYAYYRCVDAPWWYISDEVKNRLKPYEDAEHIVRCKDCRWGREVCGNIECSADINEPPEYHGYNWFCPNGEEKK